MSTAWRRDVESSDATRADLERQVRDVRSEVEVLRATVDRINAANAAAERTRRDTAEFLLADEFVLRDPIVAVPPGRTACTARDLELVGPPNLAFLRFFNRTNRPCVLLDHPTVQGLDARGVWRTIPVLPSLGSSYTDGPAWTGVFDRTSAGVLSIRSHEVTPEVGHCVTGAASPETFTEVRLVLPGQAAPVALPGSRFVLGECRPTLLLWAFDSTDQ